MLNKYKFSLLIVMAGLVFTACKKEETNPATEKQTGYLLYTQLTDGSGTDYVQYFETLPSGTVDNTQGKSFTSFFSGGLAYDNYVVSLEVNGAGSGMSKVMANTDGEVFVKGTLPTVGSTAWGIVRDATTAYADDRNDNNILIFDPSTMQNKGIIDMSNAFRAPQWTSSQFEGFVVRGNDLFVCTRPLDATGSLYASDSCIYNHIDLVTGTFQKSFFFPNADLARRNNQNWVDEQGNVYIYQSGKINVPQTVKPSILKIPAGATEFDPNYNFKFIDATGGAALSLPVQAGGGFNYHKNGKAYAIASTSFPPELLAFLAVKGTNFSTWTPEDYQTAFGILETAANGQYVELDLVAQTAKVLTDIPSTSPFNGNTFIVDDKIYCVVSTPNENALYEYDPATGTSRKAFDVSAGGTIGSFVKLGN